MITASRSKNAEEALLAYIFAQPEDFQYVMNNIAPEHFTLEENKKVFETLVHKYNKCGICDFNLLLQELDLNEAARLAAIFSKNSIINKTQQDAKQYIKTIKDEFEKNKLKNADNLNDKQIKEYIDKLRKEKK